MRKALLFLFLLSITILLINSCGDSAKKESAEDKASNNETLSKDEKKEYRKTGKEIVKSSFEALSSHLKFAMESGGVDGAIQYCSVKAIPLVDSLSEAHNVEVRRTSAKYRNPEDKPTDFEKKMLNYFKKKKEEGKKLHPAVKKGPDGKVTYFHPITIGNKLCLNCHGEPGKTMTEESLKSIKELYPEDRATGYKQGDFRGLWVIIFNMSK